MTATSRAFTATCLMLRAFAGQEQSGTTYQFSTEQYAIEMTVNFHEPHRGRRLAFYSTSRPQREICLNANGVEGRCIERFVGAVATVRYSVRRRGKPARHARIREHVTVLEQSAGLPERPPFEKTIEVVNGIGSDLQVFGYDEGEVEEADRERSRREASQFVWRVYRQELYVEKELFAVVEWKHTVDRIWLLGARGSVAR